MRRLQFPGRDWETATPAEVGLRPGPLGELVEFAQRINSNCVAVVKDGYIVAEGYWHGFDRDTDQEIFSASKSVTSTLVGIAADMGLLDVSQKAADFIPEWRGTPSEEVTVRDLLSNVSGREHDFRTDYIEMAVGARDKTRFAIELGQQHEPGTVWVYNNSAIQTLEAVLEKATGRPVGLFASEELFRPLGMTSEIATDPAGNALTFMGTRASCGDLARFGWMAANLGRWGDRQVVSEKWMREATTPSSELNRAYGYLWWLNADGGWVLPSGRRVEDGWFWPDAPPDAFAALGLGGQIALVFPTEKVVVVRIGPYKSDEQVRDQGNAVNEFARLVMESLGEKGAAHGDDSAADAAGEEGGVGD
ncbi:MAG: serine hydrolase [Acidimicrobiales bacterium]|nr:MAG: serine hydrolase [Acidimicrobiales bacterium]